MGCVDVHCLLPVIERVHGCIINKLNSVHRDFIFVIGVSYVSVCLKALTKVLAPLPPPLQ